MVFSQAKINERQIRFNSKSHVEDSLFEKREPWGHSSSSNKDEADLETSSQKERHNFWLFWARFYIFSPLFNPVPLWNINKFWGVEALKIERWQHFLSLSKFEVEKLYLLFSSYLSWTMSFPGSSDSKESACQCRRPRFNPWVRKIPWRREWQPTPIFLPGESHGQQSLVGYSPLGSKESDTAEQLTFSLFFFSMQLQSLVKVTRGMNCVYKGWALNTPMPPWGSFLFSQLFSVEGMLLLRKDQSKKSHASLQTTSPHRGLESMPPPYSVSMQCHEKRQTL